MSYSSSGGRSAPSSSGDLHRQRSVGTRPYAHSSSTSSVPLYVYRPTSDQYLSPANLEPSPRRTEPETHYVSSQSGYTTRPRSPPRYAPSPSAHRDHGRHRANGPPDDRSHRHSTSSSRPRSPYPPIMLEDIRTGGLTAPSHRARSHSAVDHPSNHRWPPESAWSPTLDSARHKVHRDSQVRDRLISRDNETNPHRERRDVWFKARELQSQEVHMLMKLTLERATLPANMHWAVQVGPWLHELGSNANGHKTLKRAKLYGPEIWKPNLAKVVATTRMTDREIELAGEPCSASRQS